MFINGESMILYHGSNIIVKNPTLLESKRALDFGKAFYLTSDLEQAKKWAIRTTERRNDGKATVSSYKVNDNIWNELSIKKFLQPDKDWLHYITANRKQISLVDNYDVVIGPVANDQTIATIGIYLRGYITEDMAIELLLPQKLKDQYALKTAKAISAINFMESITI